MATVNSTHRYLSPLMALINETVKNTKFEISALLGCYAALSGNSSNNVSGQCISPIFKGHSPMKQLTGLLDPSYRQNFWPAA
jgi:hypothetical protein